MADVTFHLEVFEGPLDLLLHLLSKNKIDIKDIPIAEILEQYLEYLEQMRQMDIEITGDFIAMASQLVYIKSKMLLPVYKNEEGEEEDPRASLIEALLDYQRVKQVGSMLLERYELGKDIFTKDRQPLEPDPDQLYGNTSEQLRKAMAVILERAQRRQPPPTESFDGIVGGVQVSVNDKLTMILERFKTNKKLSFTELVLESKSRQEMVAVFLAVLELSRTSSLIIEDDGEEYSLILSEGDDGAE